MTSILSRDRTRAATVRSPIFDYTGWRPMQTRTLRLPPRLMVVLMAGVVALGSAAACQPAVPGDDDAGSGEDVELAAAETPAAQPAGRPAQSPRNANYTIEAVLDPDARTLEGRSVVTWRNISSRPASELRFPLYYNAWKNTRSTWMREQMLARSSRLASRPAEDWGWITVTSLRLPATDDTAGVDLTDRLRHVAPDDGNPDDQTVLAVPLPQRVNPGETVEVEIEWTSKIPRTFSRTGAIGDFFFIAQWFPKIGVLEDSGWNCHQFHAGTEFFADYGVYDVRMTLPNDFVVGATGMEVEVIENADGTATHYYHAEDVHDFAWTASPEFRVFEGKAQDVEIRALLQPDHAAQGERHIEAAKVAVEYFQDHFGDYPYPNLTVVDPRRGAGGSGGMEYPTLITAGTYYNLPAGLRSVELVIIHEFGHNYWYHLLASNEFEEAWMDEGINTYTDGRVFEDHYGGYVIDLLGFKLTEEQRNRLTNIAVPKSDPIYRKAWENYDRNSYAANSYSRPGLILQTLRNYLGPETMEEAMRTYVSRWRFKHPKTEDFVQVMSDVAGEDLSWYFDQALFTNATLDYSVSAVRSEDLEEAGYDFDRTVEEPWRVSEEDNDSPSRDDNPEETQADAPKFYTNEVSIRRLGEFRFPVEIEIIFEDGEVIREDWDGQELWKKFTYRRPVRLSSATVDPDKKIPLDVSYTNNSRTFEPRALGINKVAARWTFWWQCILDLLAL